MKPAAVLSDNVAVYRSSGKTETATHRKQTETLSVIDYSVCGEFYGIGL